ncbi:GDSL-type esterase/lipase family protein [Sphingobium naphthae]|uniref:GDSL-type esterase/lipase family protein n=1 Tax=Sphingobium naphthae TaxID=1886786 RepID=UPI003749296B
MSMANTGSARSTVIKAPAPWGLAALLLAVPMAAPRAAGAAPPAPVPNADPAFPFSREIDAFAKANSAGPPVRDATLFLGSSSIRLWDIAGSFRDIRTVNRGFGGATTPHVLHYYKRLLPPVAPRAIVVYVGENDLAAGAAPETVANDIMTLLRWLRRDYPRAAISWLSLKPSPIRWTLRPKMAQVNAMVAARAPRVRVEYLDVGTVLLAPDGLPDASLFTRDGLHMNAKGYQRWSRLVHAWLDQETAAGSPGAS